MSKAKTPRHVQPENWPDLLAYANALSRFARTRDPDEFTEFHITHEAMATALISIANGADAREVFRQAAAPHRQSLKLYNRTRAFVYWKARIDGATPGEAVIAAQKHFSDLPEVSEATVKKLARNYRDEALGRYEKAGVDTSNVRAQLATRSKKGNWD